MAIPIVALVARAPRSVAPLPLAALKHTHFRTEERPEIGSVLEEVTNRIVVLAGGFTASAGRASIPEGVGRTDCKGRYVEFSPKL